MKVYISGPMTGRDEAEHKRHFWQAERVLQGMRHVAINPERLGEAYPQIDYGTLLRMDLELLAGCDGIYMLQGWEQSTGAMKEHDKAVDLGLVVMYEKEGQE